MKLSDLLNTGALAVYTTLLMIGLVTVLDLDSKTCRPKPQVIESVESKPDNTTDSEPEVKSSLKLIPLNLNE